MTITNDAQAEAAREALDHRTKWLEWVEANKVDIFSGYETEKVVAALAAYEAQKAANIVLSDHEKIMLDYSLLSRGQCKRAIASLEEKGFVTSSDESDFVCDSTPAGRAHLAAQKPKPKWEVWINVDEEKLICSCPTPQIAAYICTFYNSAQVREVRDA